MKSDKYQKLICIIHDTWVIHKRLDELLIKLCETKGTEYKVFKHLIEQVFELKLAINTLKDIHDTLINQEINNG